MQRVDVASLELCRELYDLSDWEETGLAYISRTTGEQHIIATDYETPGENWDFDWAYDLSYLLRKLPKVGNSGVYAHTTISDHQRTPQRQEWYTVFECEDGTYIDLYADTPEDAMCMMIIELFRQNILKRDDGESV